MKCEFIHTAEFRSQARKLGLTLEDVRAIENEIMDDPDASPVMAGTNGLRKMRFAPESTSGGKSGGIRVCYFVIISAAHVWMVTAFGKHKKPNVSPAERSAIAQSIAKIKARYER